MAADRAVMSEGLYMTEEQYLALDDATDGNYEYYNGYVVMVRPPSSAYGAPVPLDMAGGSPVHAELCIRIGGLIDQALGDTPCHVYSSDVKLSLGPDRNYYHPDLAVGCTEPGGKVITDPVLVIEVLSPATEKRDRGPKLETYKELPSIQEIVLVGSEAPEIIIYRRENHWRPYHYRSGDLVELHSLSISFPFEEVYRKIKFGA